MAFVVETGVGLANATAYISVAFLDAYTADRGVDISASSTAEKEQAIVRASDWLDRRYRGRIRGIRLVTTQALEFPRAAAFYDDGRIIDGVPPEWEQATAELSVRAIAGPLVLDPVYDSSGRIVVEEDKQVGPLRKRLKFADFGQTVGWRSYAEIEGLVRELVTEGQTLLRM